MAGEASAQGIEVYGAVMLVDLDGVSTAEGDVSAVLAGEVSKDALAADLAVGARSVGGDFGVVQITVVCRGAEACGVPEVEGEEGATHEMRLAGEELEGFGDLDGGGQIDGGGEDSGGVACFYVAGGGLGEDAGEAGGGRDGCWLLVAGCWLREDVHGGGVGTDGCGVDPGKAALDGEVVDEVAGLEVVGGVEDDVDGCRDEVGYVGWGEVTDACVDGDAGVKEGDVAAGCLSLGEGVAGVGFVEEDLSLEVGWLNEVAVDEGEGTDSGAGEERGRGRSHSPAAYDGDVGGGEALLAEGADAGEENLAGVAVVIRDCSGGIGDCASGGGAGGRVVLGRELWGHVCALV